MLGGGTISADTPICEHTTVAVTGDLADHLNRMSLQGWEHYQTIPGAVDGEGFRPVGVTMFFRRPMAGKKEKEPTSSASAPGRGKRQS